MAPGETERTCREVGARAVFEKKIQDGDAAERNKAIRQLQRETVSEVFMAEIFRGLTERLNRK